MPTRGPLARVLLALGLCCGGLLVVAGGLALRGPGLVAVGVAGGVAAALAAGVARESPGAGRHVAVEAAWQAAAWTVGVLLVISGIAVVGGGVVAAIVTGAGIVAALVVGYQRLNRKRAAAGGVARGPSAIAGGPPRAATAGTPGTGRAAGGPARALPPVAGLPTSALGREWLRTTTALGGRLQPAARESIVRRRQETLDELERRDPAGFGRWLAGGPAPGSDPAEYVRRDVRGDQAAGSDAA